MPRNGKTREEKLEKLRLARRRRYANIKSDPALYSLQKEKERQRYIKRKEQRKILSINDMTPTAKRKQRKKWRENYKNFYQRKLLRKCTLELTNGSSPSCCDNEDQLSVDEAEIKIEKDYSPTRSDAIKQDTEPSTSQVEDISTTVGFKKKNKMPRKRKTREEKLKNARLARRSKYANIKSDPALYVLQKEKERQRYIKRKEQKKILSINDMTPTAKRKQRKKWRENYNNFYQRKLLRKRTLEVTNDSSPCCSDNEDQLSVDEAEIKIEKDYSPTHSDAIKQDTEPSTSQVEDISTTVGFKKKNQMPRKKKTREEKLENARLARRRKYANIKSDPALYVLQKEKERQRYIKRKEQKKILSINDMTPTEKTKQRKKWRENFNRFYQRKINRESTIEMTNDNTPNCSDSEDPLRLDKAEIKVEMDYSPPGNETVKEDPQPSTSEDSERLEDIPAIETLKKRVTRLKHIVIQRTKVFKSKINALENKNESYKKLIITLRKRLQSSYARPNDQLNDKPTYPEVKKENVDL